MATRHISDDGTVTVETAAAFGILAIVATLAVQVVLLGTSYLLAGQAVREGAREAALGARADQVEDLVHAVSGRSDATVTMTPRIRAPGDLVEVRIRMTAPIVPLIDDLVPDLWVETAALMRVEVNGWN
ncbi:MAG: hypothetical protein ACLGH3_05525 [Actinomycetota bacterium]